MIARAGGQDSGRAPHPARALVFAPRALKDLGKLPADAQRQVAAALERFATTGHGDIKKLTDEHPPAHRLRVGDWRARLALSADAVNVLRVANRRDAY